MGVLFDYFRAPDASTAAAVLERLGGPTTPDANAPLVDAVAGKGFEPEVMLRTLQSLLTGVPYEELPGGRWHAKLLSVPWRTLLVEPREPARSLGLLDLAEHDRPRHRTPTLVVWVRTQGSRDRLRDRVSVLRRGLDDRRHAPHAATGLEWLIVHATRVSPGRAAVLQLTDPIVVLAARHPAWPGSRVGR